jgi:hypothetical protein
MVLAARVIENSRIGGRLHQPIIKPPAITYRRRSITMAKIVKIIEVMSESPNSWEEATQNVVTEASKTLRNIRSV